MSNDPEPAGDFADAIDTTTSEIEIEDDLLDRAKAAYPACSTRRELVRRVFERGLCARERELEARDRQPRDRG